MTSVETTAPARRRRILAAFGTRPEVVKMTPVVLALRAAGHDVYTVFTGQHASPAMGASLGAKLGMVPDVSFELPENRDARVGAIYADALREVRRRGPEIVLALGDTDTVPAYAIAARRSGVAFVHVEAGLRSFNEKSIEELNRRIASIEAALHFAPTELARSFLLHERVEPDRIFVVGNPVIDAIESIGLDRVPPASRHGVLVTAHRPTNVDDDRRLERLVKLVNALSECIGPVTFPVHPRTAHRLAITGARSQVGSEVTLGEPLEYAALLDVLRQSLLVVTDSGGIQEEASYFGVPVVVLRGSTPRWEGIENGSAALGSLESDEHAAAAISLASRLVETSELDRVASLACPYGRGDTGIQIAQVLGRASVDRFLTLREPDFTDGSLPW